MLQRTRCPYFRDVTWQACNKRAPGCAALRGFNRQHAVLGTSEACIATYAGDFAQALIALDATVDVLGSDGCRQVPFSELHVQPGQTPDVETTLAPDDLILGFEMPIEPWMRRSLYLKIRDRESYEFALASAAVALDLADGTIRQARIALGGVAAVPWRAHEAEQALIGRAPDEATCQLAADVAFADARPMDAAARTAGFGRLGVTLVEEYAEFVPHGLTPDGIDKLYAGVPRFTGGSMMKDRIQYAFGAEFIEVRIHTRTREIRVPRVVGAFAAGHIVNPKTAHSQLMGGLIWGVSSALHEATEMDLGAARYINDNLADYLVPVNADIEDVAVILVPERDSLVNPAGIKGLGELGNVGTNAAVANAVYHATGRRIRELPVRLEKLLT